MGRVGQICVCACACACAFFFLLFLLSIFCVSGFFVATHPWIAFAATTIVITPSSKLHWPETSASVDRCQDGASLARSVTPYLCSATTNGLGRSPPHSWSLPMPYVFLRLKRSVSCGRHLCRGWRRQEWRFWWKRRLSDGEGKDLG